MTALTAVRRLEPLGGRFAWLLLLPALLLPLAGRTLRAESGDELRLPQPGVKLKSGLEMSIDYRAAGANGYRPLRIKAWPTPAGTKATARRVLRIEVTPHSWSTATRVTAGQFLEIAEGAESGSCTIYWPQDREIHMLDFVVYEDGERLSDLSGQYALTNWGAGHWSEARPGVLVFDADAPTNEERAEWLAEVRGRAAKGEKQERLPDVRPLAQLTGENAWAVNAVGAQHPSDPLLMDQLRSWDRIGLRAPRNLPHNWLDYSTYDVIFLPLADLRRIVVEEPEGWRALRDWVSTGRLLCVTGAGENFEQLEAIEQAAGMAPLPNAERSKRRAWTTPSPAAFGADIAMLRQNAQPGTVYYPQPGIAFGGVGMAVATAPPPEAALVPADNSQAGQETAKRLAESTFVWRPWGMGAVAAFASENPFPGEPSQWHGFFNSIPSSYWMWYERYGMSTRRTNPGFWNGWIPGIGKAPVATFLVLITLFAIVIGPVNFVWLRRKKRPYLMLVTVPLGASLVTLLLLGYAVISDGLGIRVRLRSVTWIDQPAGFASTWSRQTYYAGLAPSDGMLFPSQASVFPLEPHPQIHHVSGGRRTIEWTDDGQRLASGYLQARALRQFFVVHPTESTAAIEFRRAGESRSTGDEPAPPAAVNRLGAPIVGLLVSDSERRFYWADGAADGEPLRLAPIDVEAARGKLARLINEHPLAAPEGTEQIEQNLPWRYRMNYYNDLDSNLSPPNVFASRLETQLRQLALLDTVPARSYVAVVTGSSLVPKGVERYEEVGSLHVVLGRW